MEDYPPHYVQHNLPLILVSGFGELEEARSLHTARQESGTRISTESPECLSDQASRLLQALRSLDGAERAWNSSALPGPDSAVRYKIKTVGRSYSLPARKAAPLPQSPGAEGPSVSKNTELHSPLSPLSPGSPVFPDGVFTPLWMHKHQEQVPCLFLAVFHISANEAAQDERLRGDISAIRNALARSMYKTRVAVFLISDRSILDAPDLEDRLGTIRRATNLESRTGLFFMPPMTSDAEITTFVQDAMKALQPLCIDYYRDLTKHARRKKARGGPPPLSGTPVGGASQATTQSGWNVRYEVKQAIFAEFRQEMDVAERHFSAALEELFSTEGGVLETTTNWSPRWNEARLLSDVTALRILRCQLWTRQTTGAVQSWLNYKLRMKDLVDRRGRGSGSYAWHAWESRWSNVMSQLIQLADIAPPPTPPQGDSISAHEVRVFSQPEKAVAVTDRLPPWYFLHHSGYWLRLFGKGIKSRLEKALAIPEEDRISPGQSPASSVANRWRTYDSYLVPGPHRELPLEGQGSYDHVAELSTACVRAAEEFSARQQIRMSEQIRMELAEDLIGACRRSEALQLLRPLWENSCWRDDEWHIPFLRLLRLLIDCAQDDDSTQNFPLLPALTWELLAAGSSDVPKAQLDLMQCLHEREALDTISLIFTDRERMCPFTIYFAFGARTGFVGDLQDCQLTIIFNGPEHATPVTLSSLTIKLGGKLIQIASERDESTTAPASLFCALPRLEERDDGTLRAGEDLQFSPRRMRTLSFKVALRDPQDCHVEEISMRVEGQSFTIVHKLTEAYILPTNRWRLVDNGQVHSVLLPHMDSKACAILPRPPKLQIVLENPRKQYFTDEHIRIRFKLINEETESLTGKIVPQIVSNEDQSLELAWDGQSDMTALVSDLAAASSTTHDLLIHAPPEATSVSMRLDVEYTLATDSAATLLKKEFVFELVFVPAFETKFTFSPRLHSEPWPSYFMQSIGDSPHGIKQQWSLGAELSLLTEQHVVFRKLELVVHEIQGGAACTIPIAIQDLEAPVDADRKHTATFELTTQKFSLDDRQPSYLDLSLIATWSSHTDAEEAETIIEAPRFTIPTSEPRVLCTVLPSSSNSGHTLEYHIENPSTHFLTFAVTMEASDDFGFSGPKHRALSIAPLSRQSIEYHLLLHSEPEGDGRWISPNLQVVDSYYNKNLRVHPGNDGVKLGKEKEILVWLGSSGSS
ncbi:Putative trafficking protein particle complex subunit 11 [Septoria linicola]|uniref:Trafficking protein particle complex subunit 11 n=1 Tax=Septoria linicola TaxID=215465 RepID=A0A9Q9ALT3_9PEZI|nr:putative trafficking protein particle complex subunit 11 [Septoria linicola]USW47156.1 Putative trafficking protein particle complex subunit 11 [Septoria linicola]